MKRRIVSLFLAMLLGLSLVACGGGGGEESGGDEVDTSGMSYDELSDYIYDSVLGEFYETYQAAKASSDTSERFALMAIAEAKLLESGVLLPNYTAGGTYTISRVAPRTSAYVLWGSDYERYHQSLVTTELISNEHRSEMLQKWSELRGTGTYESWAKSYLLDKGYTLKDELNRSYRYNPTTWDVFSSYLASNSTAIVNTYDGLYEYDSEGYIQPALATSYDVSEDGCVYTFHLREGVMWVDSQGREIAEVCADDFVAGMQHLLDAKSGIEYLAGASGGCNIVNADAYADGSVTDFAEVGVKALDDYTVEYTLAAPCSFFETMLGYTPFAPLCRTFYESMGGKFGAEYDPSAASYTYGLDPNSIAYCGPYLVTSATENNSIVFDTNESYWNKDNINVKKIVWRFDDGADVTKTYRDALSGVIDTASLNTSTIESAKAEGVFDQYAYVADTDATTYVFYLNLNRAAFHNYNDDTKAVSPQTEEDAARTNAAVNNIHFRRALTFSVDRASYNAQNVGEALKYTSLRNSYTPGNFVRLAEDVTVSINGTDTTFAAGTYYGEIMQAQLDADEYPITVWDPEANDGLGSGDGFDGWYDPANAAAELEQAIAELAEQDVEVSAENPIYIDFPYVSSSENYSNRANAYKQSVEASTNGCVSVNLIPVSDFTEWGYCGYYTGSGADSNMDVYDYTGWIPDFGDPCCYLDTILPDYQGYQTKCLGIY